MLILSRKRSESVIIGSGDHQVTLVVVEIRGDKVRLGFDAPADLPIHRKEVWLAIQRQTQDVRGQRIVDLGWANGWTEKPGIIVDCEAAGHAQVDRTVGPCTHEIVCRECGYFYRVDSSD